MTLPHMTPRGAHPGRLFGLLTLNSALVAVIVTAAAPASRPALAADPTRPKSTDTLVGGLPLFSTWPKNHQPDAVLVLTGQTFGYLQPCGCSRPQMGGLERRAVFMDSLRAKGWPVAGIDLGDLYPEKVALSDQGKLKYLATMNALREMGYVAVGIGQTEIKADLISLLAGYALQKEQRPFTLAGNAEGKTLGKQYFPVPPGAKRPIVDQIEVVRLGRIPVGVAGVVGPGLQQENAKNKWDDALDFTNTNAAIAGALKALDNHADKPSLKILIFQGPSGDAAKVAAAFPEFQAILCQSDSDLPPLQPQSIPQKGGAATLVIQVGHRGQHVGVLGAFKKPEGGGFDLKYQLVPMGEEYITPGATESEALSANKALQALDEYARNVKSANLLPEYPRTPHPAQIHAQSLKPAVALKYVGTDACQACHAAEFNKWKTASHSHAMETLEKVAKRPSLRNFDGECVKCHTVGFDYHSGYIDDKKSAHLRNVGCESCHGPGSGHVAAPKNKDFLGYMMPWKQQNALKLPDGKFMKMMAEKAPSDRGSVAIAPAQQILLRQVENMCLKCHDHEADPHFDLFKNWQKIDHTGLAPPGGWPVVPPK